MNKDERKAAFDAARALVELEDFMMPNHTLLMAAKYTKD